MRATASAGAVCLLLAACMGPRPEAPPESAVVAPTAWRDTTLGDATIEADWWRRFRDPNLSSLVERARTRNVDVSIAASRVAEAQAGLKAALASQRPEIDLLSGGAYSKTVTLGTPVTALGGEAEVTATWDLDLFGRLKEASAAARSTLLLSRASKDAVALEVASTTAQAYIELLGADARLAIIRDTIATREASFELARHLRDSGYSSDLELDQAEGEYRAARQLLPSTLLTIAKLENLISTLVDDVPRSISRPPGGLDAVTVPVIPAGLPASVLRRRPDIVAAEDALVAADHTLDSARAALLPDVSLSGAAGALTADVLPHPFTFFNIGGNVLAPLLDFGRRSAAADAAAARRDRAAFEYRDTVLAAFRDIEDGLTSIKRLDEQRIELEAQVKAQAQTLRAAKLRYQTGYSSYLNQLDAERQLLSARLALTQTQADGLKAYVGLYRALGGGWTSP
jgi:multidrug efflux system outer membrane protein